jgi:hypothetical protein
LPTATQERPQLKINQEPQEWRSVFEAHKELIGSDPVFKEIAQSIEEGWDKLTPNQRKQVIEWVEDIITKLTEYYDAYKNLKSAAKRRFYFEDYQRLRESISRADERERILHNAFLDSLNILSRNMRRMGLNNSWRQNDEIFGLTEEAKREKPKLWMLKLFGEKL